MSLSQTQKLALVGFGLAGVGALLYLSAGKASAAGAAAAPGDRVLAPLSEITETQSGQSIGAMFASLGLPLLPDASAWVEVAQASGDIKGKLIAIRGPDGTDAPIPPEQQPNVTVKKSAVKQTAKPSQPLQLSQPVAPAPSSATDQPPQDIANGAFVWPGGLVYYETPTKPVAGDTVGLRFTVQNKPGLAEALDTVPATLLWISPDSAKGIVRIWFGIDFGPDGGVPGGTKLWVANAAANLFNRGV